jgi:integrase
VPTYALVKIGNSPRWYIQWSEGGRSHRASTGTADREQAEAVCAAFRLERERHPEGPVTISQILEWYLEQKRSQLQSLDTAERAVKRMQAFFGTTLAVDCGPSLQTQYIDYRRKTVKDETIQRDLTVLSAALRRAHLHEKLASIPPVLTLQKAEPKERWLSRHEAAVMFNRLRTQRVPHLLLFAQLALYTGARSTAILQLTWDRVDLDRRTAWYPLPGRRRTGKRRVVTPLTPRLVRQLRAAKLRAKSDHVIEWRGKPVARVVRAFHNHMHAIDLKDVTPHTLRHTFATWAARKGHSLHAIGGVLGQSVAATTERYAKHQPEALRAVVDDVWRK